MRKQFYKFTTLLIVVYGLAAADWVHAQWQAEWERVQAAARKEGKLVVNIPPSAELRKALEETLKQKFGIELEIVLSSSATTTKRVGDEFKAGVRYFDVITSTWDALSYNLLPMGIIESLDQFWILPEVKDPANWWGGHIWTDSAKKFAYSPLAYMLDNIWYNTGHAKPEELRTYDDLLAPKWKGKIAMWDPRSGGAALGIWSYLWLTKGESYLRKFTQQNPLLVEDRRLVADSLARAKVAVAIGATYYSYASFIKVGLPVKPLPPSKEGTFVSVGNGGPVVIKNHPHPNATKVYINWLLSKEGQQLYSKVFGQATRRLDVETSWMAEIGVRAAKDSITVDNFYKWQNAIEDKDLTVRRPALEFARKILP
ncbi:MAG: ABC-type Fe3+ transport system periplasmic component [Deltaproteobacteria bacterium]|nr:ABC-type Fe3+ transport system periplasmic component [Deltaproteobacteria bacterium]